MKIVMFVEDYPPGGGGGGIFVKEVAERLAAKKHEVTVITRATDDLAKDPQYMENGVTIHRISGNRISYLLKTKDWLKSNPLADIYHAHGTVVGFITKQAIGKRRPIVLHVHGYRDQGLRKFLQDRIIRMGFDRIVSADKYGLDRMAEFVPKEKLVQIRLGVDLDAFRFFPLLSNSKMRFAYVGRLEYVKGVDILLDAWTAAGLKEAELWIMGKGSGEPQVQSYKEKQSTVKTFPWIRRDELPGFYPKIQWLVLPSRSEGQSFVVLEAMASGVPIIASDLPSLRESVGESGAGMLVPIGDVKAWAEALQKAAAMPEAERKKMGQRGRAFVEKYFSWEKTVGKLEKMYGELIAGTE